MCLLTCPSIYQSISSIKRPIINTEYNLSYHIMSSSSLSLDHLPPSEQLCYVHCNICDTILAVYISIYHFLTHFTSLSRFFFLHFSTFFFVSLSCRWVFLALACSRLLLWDVVIALISFLLTCVHCFFHLLTSFIWDTLSSPQLITFWLVINYTLSLSF